MSTNDYVKYMTETFIKHFELPKEKRKQLRLDRKNARRPALIHWFGLLPISISMFIKRRG
ncbi:YqzE family protein [Bacillus sp. FJAT-49711]|uniref:YqzE family protein n=1 Tax=Bacillus sp. FJAT-49711 TaxID=2833585 RepID=UPI001BC96984|nr:YqzE family protein [Bacillus sp. FJAT-49711]MBS4217166.1 YqzE family protein [Bacillus sp. FJAT-49711]